MAVFVLRQQYCRSHCILPWKYWYGEKYSAWPAGQSVTLCFPHQYL